MIKMLVGVGNSRYSNHNLTTKLVNAIYEQKLIDIMLLKIWIKQYESRATFIN